MKIICVMVSSLDGKITKGNNPSIHEWTSSEDQVYFSQLIKENALIFMGRNTYENAKSMMQHTEGKLRIVFTRQPERYKKEQIPGMLEFTNEDPIKVTKRLEQTNKQALLVGGSEINTLFLQKKLINELWLTVEPIALGTGKTLFTNTSLVSLKLFECTKLNKKGTSLLKYHILY
ncbi:MAG: dihydrofolate reductase family protein [Candidatus Levyibacteriota bacterium]